MIEKIFRNPGKKLKNVYKAVFAIFVGISIAIYAVALLVALGTAIDDGEIGRFILVLIGVPLVEFIYLFLIWLGMLAMVTFADMAIDIKEIKNKIDSVGAASAAVVEEPTEWVCPQCGNVNAVANNFCNQCGQHK